MKFLLEVKGAHFMVFGQPCHLRCVRNEDSKTNRSGGNIRCAGLGRSFTCSLLHSKSLTLCQAFITLLGHEELRGLLLNTCDKLLPCLAPKQTQAGVSDYVLRLWKPNLEPDTKKFQSIALGS